MKFSSQLFLLLWLMVGAFNLILAQPLKIKWVANSPCPGPSYLDYDKIFTDNQQNVYLNGTAASDINALYESAILTIRYDSSGNQLWEAKFDNLFGDIYYDSGLTVNDLFVTAGSRSSMPPSIPSRSELASYNINSGELIWQNFLFDTIIQASGLFDIDIDNLGNIYAFGLVNNYLTEFDSNKMFVAKLLPLSGEVEWMRIFQDEFNAIKGKVLNDRIRIYGGKFLGPSNYVNIMVDIDLDGNTLSSFNLPYVEYGGGISNAFFFFDEEGYLIGFGKKLVKYGPSENLVWSFDFARNLPDIRGQALAAVTDRDGNVYATGYLYDTIAIKTFTQTLKLSPQGELIWAKVHQLSPTAGYEGGRAIAVSDVHVFIGAELWYLDAFGQSDSIDYSPVLYSNSDGSIVYDTLIDVKNEDYVKHAHYAQGHFYLLGRSIEPTSSSQDDYQYQLFKFSIDETSVAIQPPLSLSDVSVYPNPTAGNIIIEQKGVQINYDRAIVLDAQGREINSFVLDNAKEKIALASTPSGRYMLRLMNERSGAFTLVPLVVLPF